MATQPAPQNLDPAALILAAPEEEFALVELRLDWPPSLDIYPEHKQLWLRCFVITADPLGWIPDRGEAWTAVTVDDEVLEVDLYLTVAAVRAGMEETDGDSRAAIGRYASAVMAAALEREEELLEGDYPRRAARGEAPRLLADLDGDHGAFGTPELQAKRSWSAVGLGALTDLVQHAFGAVDARPLERPARPGRAGHRRLPGLPGPASSATRRAWRTPRSRSAARTRSRRRSSTPSASRRRATPTPPAGARSTRPSCASTSCPSRPSPRSRRASSARRRRATIPAPAAAARSTRSVTGHERRAAHRRLPVRRGALRARRRAVTTPATATARTASSARAPRRRRRR